MGVPSLGSVEAVAKKNAPPDPVGRCIYRMVAESGGSSRIEYSFTGPEYRLPFGFTRTFKIDDLGGRGFFG
ncbi:MAG: hypothetical protein COX57_10235 [Alphaproteobacteria bacterium CG_4_10_14_0_2_um_filter_63_37]|nr:MAG: hypothetical protein AUJ55_04260 [Proteobacteria bacterium CG1_02_64_396]PJA24158.1 MAG: hypothetical protein COX57_10235 [Alphaproteobacteria bacterium CG_4_10_14_0_2_um_filter_63_37]